MQIRHYSRFVVNSIVLLSLAAAGRPGFARDNYETIDAQSFGTGTQLGENIGVTLNIYQFSTPADKADPGTGVPEGTKSRVDQCSVEDEGGRTSRDHGHAGKRLLVHQDV